ncbi:hypothetical protein PspLS_08667 [Pyricularia sp. CBS 133598]|nr:hypothetical protein PspLS_08667 [Pyricularia sp. CBS 133598]
MFSLSTIALVASAILSDNVMAAPVETASVASASVASSSDFSALAAVNVQYCKDIGFRNCLTFTFQEDVCYNFNGDWNKSISSIATQTGGYQCFFWDRASCAGTRGGPVRTDNPHDDLGRHGWNDRISSIKCTRV